jgi:hypothetical protein
MMIKKTLAAAICTLFATPLFAIEEDIYNAQLSFGWSPVITLSGGPMWSSPGRYQIIYYTDMFGNTLSSEYYPIRESNTQGAAELFFALEREVVPGMAAQLGIQIGGATDAQLKGLTTVSGIPGVYRYSYNVNHTRLGLKGKLIALRPTLVQPYISGGFGASWNQSHLFYTAPTGAFAPYTPWFNNDTVIGFTFSFGIGIQKTFCRSWRLGVGYEFDSLGKSNLGADTKYPYYIDGIGMRSSNWYAHQLQFSLAYSY